MTTALRTGTTRAVMDGLYPKEHPYLHDPNGWMEDVLGEELWSKLREINESVAENRYTAVHSAHDIGKSWDASRLVCWWLDVHPVGSAFVVTTAPTDPQVKAILWREIRRAHAKGKLEGRITLEAQWYMGADELVAYGRKPADYNPAAFQGIHARYVLVIIDEACGVPLTLFNAVDSLVTNENSRALAIGNPDDPISQFEVICRPGSGWNAVHVSAFDTPNFTGEPISTELSEQLVSPVWVEERRKRWGVNSPIYMSKVEGRFPEDADDAVVPASWMAKSRLPRETKQAKEPRWMGVDVGAGGDESVISMRRGPVGRILHQDRVPDTMKTAEKVMELAVLHRITKINIDSIGIGKGVGDRVKQLVRAHVAAGGDRIEVNLVNVGEKSDDPTRFPLLRDQLWWEIARELSEEQLWDLSEIGDDAAAQLTSPKYGLDSRGRVKVEPKKETKERLGSSPDMADSIILSYYNGRPTKRWRIV